jgi:sarcosine oxidase subunit gamma
VSDLSPLPRFGLKGKETGPWLEAHEYHVGKTSNRAYPQKQGGLAVRLSPVELLFLCDPENPELDADYDYFIPGRNCYPIRRQDSHYWFSISGQTADVMLAKLCGVDFSPARFANHRVAQTRVAATGATVVRNDNPNDCRYYLLGDQSYARYMMNCLRDAMQEFGGIEAGVEAGFR